MRDPKHYIVAALTLLSLAGCDTSVEPTWGIIVSGTVTDSVAGYGIDSAQIDFFTRYPLDTFSLPYMYTDSKGNYRFDTEDTGPYYLTVRKSGYKTQIRTISSPSRKATLSNVDFKLVKP